MKLFDFLFGKIPKIFNKKGEVVHRMDQKKLSEWKKNYTSDPEKNWRQHKGRESIFQKKRS